MATVIFIKESKQTPSAMRGCINYCVQEKKTVDENGRQYIGGVNCLGQHAYDEFMATKNLYGKTSGTYFYQYVQSFMPGEITSYRSESEGSAGRQSGAFETGWESEREIYLRSRLERENSARKVRGFAYENEAVDHDSDSINDRRFGSFKYGDNRTELTISSLLCYVFCGIMEAHTNQAALT